MAGPMLERLGTVLVKTEATEGTYAAPSATTNALQVFNLQPTVNSQEIVRQILRNTLSSPGFIPGETFLEFKFDTELRAIGTVPTAVAPLREDVLYRAALWVPVYTAGPPADVTYGLTSDNFSTVSTCSASVNLDGLAFRLAGCRANLATNLTGGQLPTLTWTLRGAFLGITNPPGGSDAVVDEALPTPTFQAPSVLPLPFMGAQFTMHSFAGIIQKLTMDMGNDIRARKDVTKPFNIRSFFVGNRKMVGTMDPEQMLRADHDIWARWVGMTSGAINVVHGSGVGGTITLNWPTTQYRAPKIGTRELLRTNDLDWEATGTDNEATIKYS